MELSLKFLVKEITTKSAMPGIPAQIRTALIEPAGSVVYLSDGGQGMTRIPKCSIHNIEKTLKRWIPNPGASGCRGYTPKVLLESYFETFVFYTELTVVIEGFFFTIVEDVP